MCMGRVDNWDRDGPWAAPVWPHETLPGARFTAHPPKAEKRVSWGWDKATPEKNFCTGVRVRKAKPKGKYHEETLALAGDWYRAYHGPAPIPQMAKLLRPLLETMPFSELQIEWRHFLAQTPAQFVSIPKFVATHGSYAPVTRSVVFTPRTTKVVEIRENGRARMIEVPLDDPRPEL